MKKINIALDGYAGCGKSTTARLLASRLHYIFIDTGSMYRAFTLYLLEKKIPYTDLTAVLKAISDIKLSFQIHPETLHCEIFLNKSNVQSRIRTKEVSEIVSEVSTIKEVRHFLVEQQRQMGKSKGVVMDGRDIGTVVFPDAELKVFMMASLEARVARRKLEMKELGIRITEQELLENLQHRDYIDTTRDESPLRQATDAKLLDTTNLSIEQQVEQVLIWAQELMKIPSSS